MFAGTYGEPRLLFVDTTPTWRPGYRNGILIRPLENGLFDGKSKWRWTNSELLEPGILLRGLQEKRLGSVGELPERALRHRYIAFTPERTAKIETQMTSVRHAAEAAISL